MTRKNNNVIEYVFGRLDDKEKCSRALLPEELNLWYLNIRGYDCIACILKKNYSKNMDLKKVVLPCSVEKVLNGYEISDEGYVLIESC
jgi:hypothetical protein